MKVLLSLACILIAVFTVNAHGDRNWFGYGPGPFPFGFPGGGIFGYGWDSKDIDELPSWFCSCRGNPCGRSTGSKQIGCPYTNKYLQCAADQTCSIKTCPSGQVWDKTQKACATCASGMHVASNQRVCVCDQGTTFDPRSRTCVECPTDSVKEPDRCYCNQSKAFDYKTKACRDCPQGATLRRYQQCSCSSNQFWSEDWICKDCPGELRPKSSKRPKCVCNGINEIFNSKTVACYVCPTGTAASPDNSYCQCTNRFQIFNMTSGNCECKKGYVADAAGTGCVRAAITTQPTTTTVLAGGNP